MTHYTGTVPGYEQGTDWRDSAACRERDSHGRPVYNPELWFPTGMTGSALLEIEAAKAVCRRCPSVERCLQWALETGQDHGVWGSLSEDERRNLKRRRRARDLTAEAMTPARTPGSPRTLQSIRDESTTTNDDGHVLWTGSRNLTVDGRSYTHRQVAYAADRGHPPAGAVQTECEWSGCVHPEHISDQAERNERALEKAAAEQRGCGTATGALHHEACGEELCDSCQSAVTAAVGLLAGAGAVA